MRLDLDLPSAEEQREIWRHMRVPVFAAAALLAFLAGIILLGALMPSSVASYLEAGLTLCMMVTVLLFTMEVREDQPVLQLWAVVGFCWLTILLGMTMIDFITR